MSYLLYCIFRHCAAPEPPRLAEKPPGIGGQPVFLLAHRGLWAALSDLGDSLISAADLSQLLAYKRVVESFHRDPAVGGVIPMRYGCRFAETAQVMGLLRENGPQYEALLEEVEGCVEMGIRVLLAGGTANAECGLTNTECGMAQGESATPNPAAENRKSEIGDPIPQSPPILHGVPGSPEPHMVQGAMHNPQCPGIAYLAARRAYYAGEEQRTLAMKKLEQKIQAELTGLFVKCRSEWSPLPAQSSGIYPEPAAAKRYLLSLSFLVRWTLVEPFHRAYQSIRFPEAEKILLSGPWPPYNFVTPARLPSPPSPGSRSERGRAGIQRVTGSCPGE